MKGINMIFRKLENKVIGGDGRKRSQAVREREAVDAEEWRREKWRLLDICGSLQRWVLILPTLFEALHSLQRSLYIFPFWSFSFPISRSFSLFSQILFLALIMFSFPSGLLPERARVGWILRFLVMLHSLLLWFLVNLTEGTQFRIFLSKLVWTDNFGYQFNWFLWWWPFLYLVLV